MAMQNAPSLVHQYAFMAPSEFGKSVEPKWSVGERLVGDIREAVEQEQLTPLDGARRAGAAGAIPG